MTSPLTCPGCGRRHTPTELRQLAAHYAKKRGPLKRGRPPVLKPCKCGLNLNTVERRRHICPRAKPQRFAALVESIASAARAKGNGDPVLVTLEELAPSKGTPRCDLIAAVDWAIGHGVLFGRKIYGGPVVSARGFASYYVERQFFEREEWPLDVSDFYAGSFVLEPVEV